MPIYDYECTDCGHAFEELTSFDEQPPCSACGGEHTQRQFSFGGVVGSSETSCDSEQEESQEVAAESHGERLLQADSTLRGEDERSWDLERDFERRHAAQLSELAAKSVRVSELMSQIEKLEPLLAENSELSSQLNATRDSKQALEAIGREQTAELEQRSKQLQAGAIEAQGLRRQLVKTAEDAGAERETAEALVRDREHQIQDQRQEIADLQSDLANRTAALFKRDEMIQSADAVVAELEEEVREHGRGQTAWSETHETLKAELASTDAQLHEQQDLKGELERSLAKVESELGAVRDELNRTSGALQNTKQHNGQLETACASATGEVEHQRAKFLASVRHLTATQSVIEELAPMLRSLETTLGGAASSSESNPSD